MKPQSTDPRSTPSHLQEIRWQPTIVSIILQRQCSSIRTHYSVRYGEIHAVTSWVTIFDTELRIFSAVNSPHLLCCRHVRFFSIFTFFLFYWLDPMCFSTRVLSSGPPSQLALKHTFLDLRNCCIMDTFEIYREKPETLWRQNPETVSCWAPPASWASRALRALYLEPCKRWWMKDYDHI